MMPMVLLPTGPGCDECGDEAILETPDGDTLCESCATSGLLYGELLVDEVC